MMSRGHRLSIRAQLLLLVLSVVLPAVAMVAYYVVHDAQEAKDEAHAKVKILADNTQSILEQLLREQEAVLSRFAARPRIRALDPRDCDPVIGEYLRSHPGFTTLAVRDVQGNLICSSDSNPPAQAQMIGLAWFQEGIRSGRFTVSDAYLGPSSGRWVSVLSYPIRDVQGKVSGLILLGVDLLQFNERLFQRSPKNAVQMVLDRDDKFLLRSVDFAEWIGKPFPSPQADAIRGRSAGFVSARGVRGVQRLYAVETVPGTGWRVFAGLPEDEVFADYRERLARVAVIGLVVLMLVLAAALRFGSAIARPIGELAETAARIAGGNTAARARVAGPAEIEFVAQEFNRMLDAQKRQREERAALVGHFEQLVRLARDIFVLIDPAGNIVEANDAAVAAYGYGADELRGMNIRALRAPESRTTLEQHWQATTRPGGVLFETVHRRRDGSTFPVEVSSRAIDIDGKPYRQSFVRDISERHAAEAQIRRLNTAYVTLSETNKAIVRLQDVNKLFPRICRIAVEFGGYVGASVGLVDEQNRRIVPAAIDGSIGDYVRQISISTDPARPEDRGPAALALREGRSYYCQDFLEDPATEPWHGLAAEFGVRSLAALPLRRGGAVIGTLNLYSAEPGVFDAPTRALLEEMAVDISFALDNSEREAEIDRYTARLERAMQSTLTAVSLMVELRDPYTAGHERRVGELAAAIGAEMGLSDDTVKGLRLAGYVHDIGKISVPAEILSKPSRLTPMEFELIKSHSQSGHDVLQGVDFPWPLAEVILQHHERLDGSGYPRKLKGDEILLEARIMAVADVVEAMSSHRPYRPGLGLDLALEEIAKNSAKIYDPQVAAACLRLFRDKAYALTA